MNQINHESALRVARVVWPWQAARNASAAKRTSSWRRALIQGMIMAGAAALMVLVGRHYWLGGILFGLAIGVLVSFLFIPPVYRAWERFGGALATGVAVSLTWLLLTPFYYLCVFPVRLILRMAGKDPMQRRWEPRRDSYWSEHKPVGKNSYTRQY